MTRFWKLELVIACALLVAGCWLLPYRFPPSGFVAGASNDLGFNNAVSYAWYFAFLIVPAFIVARGYASKFDAVRPRERDHRTRLVLWVFGVVAGLHVMAFAALYLYKGRLFFSEAIYFQIVLLRMVAGERPYLDVSFYYGPSMIYPPYWLTKLMSPQAAYAVSYIATYVAGLGMLLALLRRFLKSDTEAAGWFVLLSIGLINPWNGLNVTLVRYLLPSLVLVLVADAVQTGARRQVAAAAAVLAFALTYSFDVAAISVAASLVLIAATLMEPWLRPILSRVSAGARADRQRGGEGTPVVALGSIAARGVLVLALALGIALAFFLAVDPTGTALRMYPEIAISYAAGAHNTPVYPNLPFLTLIGLSICATALTLAWMTQETAGRSSGFVLGYLALMIVTERGAFGVSEPTHIALYALPAILLCLFWSARLARGNAFRRWIATAVIIGLLAPVQYFQSTQLWPFVAGVLKLQPRAGSPERVAVVSNRPIEQTLTDLVRCGGKNHPYLMFNLDYYSQPVYQAQNIAYVGYFPMLIAARTHAGIARMIDDMRSHDAIVIARPVDLGVFVPPPPSIGVLKVLDVVSGGPTAGSKLAEALARNQHRLFEPFTDFVRSEYRPKCEHDGLVAYAPRSE